MTRAVRDRILKEANGDISDHLRNHIHLTNCIHLKNHMHRHSPILADKSLMRDLIVLQRSRSLRDPSTSPPSWHSPSVLDLLSKQVEEDSVVREGRRSLGIELPRDGRRLSGSSLPIAILASSKVAPGETNGVLAFSDRSSKSGVRDGREINREGSSRKNMRSNPLGDSEEHSQDQESNELVHDGVSGNSEPIDKRSKQRGKHRQAVHLKTLSEQLNEIPLDSDGIASSHIHLHGRRMTAEKTREEPEASIRGYCGGLDRAKKRRLRGARRTRASRAQSELSVASNSLAQGSARHQCHLEEGEEEYGEPNVTRAPRNGCGIPWNWSRIHHRSKTILDMAGRSFSCGLSDSRSRKRGLVPRGNDVSDMPVAPDHSSSSAKFDAEALPLLVEASGSQASSDNAAWARDYSGELGIFSDHLLKHDIDSDLASEARSGRKFKFRGQRCSRHQNLTQKYMPRTFRDLVGQNLVAQALANAVAKRKVGLLYVFYGPHGTGKTSCARIFARALNCQSFEHPKPCGFCNSCIAHNMGKSRNIREVGPVSNFDFESIINLLDNMIVSQIPSQYRVFIFDDCDTLSPDCWNAISKVIDRAPRRLVFILVSSSLDLLPHIIISRCQKFFFPKLKDADIIYTMQWISAKEDLEIDKDALKLIASRSDGSLRDAEMTLEQLSLLGQRITVPLVQELVGLICDEKLVDLLDLALSADTVNTVKNLRQIMETGVEPIALMSQLATVITDILAGSSDFSKERHRRKFFRRPALSKEDMEKLRQALKTLSEAEKQLRMSNDKLTWLTAALLQLAPDQQYTLPSSSADTSFNQSPLVHSNASGRATARKSNAENAERPYSERGLPTNVRIENFHVGSSSDIHGNGKMKGSNINRRRLSGAALVPQQTSAVSSDFIRVKSRQISGKTHKEIEEIWLEVLEKIQINNIKEFMHKEGKLISVSLGAAPTVQLTFSTLLNKSKAEKFRRHILQAFESVLGSPVIIEISCESGKDVRAGVNALPVLTASDEGLSHMITNSDTFTNGSLPRTGYDDINRLVSKDKIVNGVGATQPQLLHSEPVEVGRSEIVEIVASPREPKNTEHVNNIVRPDKGLESVWVGEETASSHKTSTMASNPGRKFGDRNLSQSLVRGKVSLAHVIQQAEGCTQRSGWSKRKAVSIAEKLEQENLRLEPRSRSLLCWKASRVTRQKLSRLKIRTRKPRSLLKLVSCSKCLSSKSQR
ncbi:protein STICHEL-like 3 [Malania oleifera]|uniref:protein STICHEL-like 3 n=1 Tax=Malania oleifera TaxID=397392 RepID=UPI0025AE98BF|nr:protein STICHEL-like 3 [Malania oleifera]XP_057949887.1 protein STICHEL-like 3 [Malania oleifera]